MFSILKLLYYTMTGKRDLQAFIQSIGNFTKQLYNILSGDDGNVFFSPISAHIVLAMAYQGADGSTKEAFANALSVPDTDQAAKAYKDLLDHLNNLPNVQLLMANKIYLMQGNDLKSTFKKVVEKKFLSEVESVDFSNSRRSAEKINDWVESKTHHKIKDIMSPDSVSDSTRLVLVNAIYFKGIWASRFYKSATRTEKFYFNDNDSIDVQMMVNKDDYFYKEDATLDAKVLELPYENPDVSLIVILPNKRNGIGELQAKLASTDLSKITEGLVEEEVVVKLPKFKIETTINMEESLEKLGLGVIFDQKNANFSGMLEKEEPLYVSSVIQKAFIEVNEEGTEAAAATGAKLVYLCARIPIEFYADHEFVFLLSYKRQISLFCGRLTYPKY